MFLFNDDFTDEVKDEHIFLLFKTAVKMNKIIVMVL